MSEMEGPPATSEVYRVYKKRRAFGHRHLAPGTSDGAVFSLLRFLSRIDNLADILSHPGIPEFPSAAGRAMSPHRDEHFRLTGQS